MDENKAIEQLSQHLNKTIIDVYKENGNIIIQLDDKSTIVLKNRNCNTCGGYIIEGAEQE